MPLFSNSSHFSRQEVLSFTSSTLCVVSFMLSLFVVVTFFLFPGLKERHPNNRIICNLAIANTFAAVFQFDFFDASEQAWPPIDMCLVEAIGNQFFYMASFFWTGCLALNIYIVIVRGSRDTGRYMKWYHLLSWSLPGISVGVLAYYDQFDTWKRDDPLATWCWVKPGPGQLIFYVALLLVIVLGVVTTVLTVAHVLRKQQHNTVNRASTYYWVGKVSAYIVVFILVRMWSIINRANAWLLSRGDGGPTEDSDALFVLYLLHSIGSASQGWALSLVFCVNENILRVYEARCCTRRSSERQERSALYYSANS